MLAAQVGAGMYNIPSMVVRADPYLIKLQRLVVAFSEERETLYESMQ